MGCSRGCRVVISPWAVIMAVGLGAEVCLGGAWQDGLAVLLAIVLHETGHAVAALAWGVGIGEVRLDLPGARMELEGMVSYGGEWVIAAAGPLVNLLTVPLAWGWWTEHPSSFAAALGGASLALGCLNLLPVGTLDGGRMLYCTVARWGGVRAATVVLGITSRLCLLALWLLSGYMLIAQGGMLSLHAFSLLLLIRLTQEGRA